MLANSIKNLILNARPPFPSPRLLSLMVKSVLMFSFLLFPSWTSADTRGSKIDGKAPAQLITENQGKSWAIIIGIDNYLNIAPLSYAVDDAKALAHVLARQEFAVTPLYNTQATRQSILRELQQKLFARVQKDDRVLIFFAGHIGETGRKAGGQPVGYMMPVDTEPGRLAETAISIELLRELSNGLPAKQVLFLIDICYGGINGRSLPNLPPMTKDYLQLITREPARQLITAGGTGQQALAGPKWNHSVFTYYLLEGIGKGHGDLNGDGIIPASELFAFLNEHVQSAALSHNHAQRPEMWGLSPDKGEFVFVPKKTSPEPLVAHNPSVKGKAGNPETGTIETIVGLFKNLGNPLNLFGNKASSSKKEKDEVARLEAQRILREKQQREKELEVELAEAQRLAVEEEQRQIAAEQARQEQEALLAQQQAALKAEQARLEAEEKQRRQALEKAEQTRQAQLAEAQRLAAEEEQRRIAAEQARQEQETLLAQQQAALKAEQARLAAEEEQRKQALARLAEIQRLAAEEEQRRIAAEKVREEQEAWLARQQAALKAEQARVAAEEEQRRQALAQKEEELQAQLAEARRLAAEAKAQQQRFAAEEEQRKRELELQEQTRQAQLAEARRVAAEEEQRKRELELQEQTRQAQLAEARRVAMEEEQRKRALAELEQTRRAQLAEAQRVAAKKARLAAEEEQRKQAAEARRMAALEEERRRAAAERARREQEAALKAEQARHAAEEERRKQEAEARRLAAEEEQRKQAAEARRMAALEEERRRAAAERARREQEAALKAEQARHAAEEERRKQEAEARLAAEEERRKQEAEARRLAAEEERRKQEAEARLAAEEERRKQEAEARRLAAEEEERRRAAAEQARQEQEAALKAEQARLAAEEERRRAAAEQARQKQEEKNEQPPLGAESGNNKASESLKSTQSSSETVQLMEIPSSPPIDVQPLSTDKTSSGIFGFFKNIFKEDKPQTQENHQKESQTEPVMEARVRPQDLPGTFSSQMSEKEDVPMVLIPVGRFNMGSAQEEIYFFLKEFSGVSINAFQAEIPQRQIELDAYFIDQYEVSYRQYSRFIEATGRATPKFWNDERFHQPDHPVLGVTWYDANAYCTWKGKRLPTEAEWEKAARGTQGYFYPWGNTWDPQRTNTANYWAGKTFPSISKWAEWMQTAFEGRKAGPLEIGKFSSGISPYGVHDMAGNVSEWVFDWYRPYDEQPTLIHNPKGSEAGTMKVHRGGSWSVSSIFARTTYRARENPGEGSPYIGLRCAKNSK